MNKDNPNNSGRISPDMRRRLAKHLQGQFDIDSIQRFLMSVSAAVDSMEKTADTGLSDSEIKTRLEQLETSIQRLNNRLTQMDERTIDAVAIHFQTLLQSSDWDTKDLKHLRESQPNFKEWLGRILEDLRVMNIVFHHAHSQIDGNNGQQLKINKRDFVESIVEIYIREFGVKPEAKQWFIDFMSELGECIGNQNREKVIS